jgi:hypothetical protein
MADPIYGPDPISAVSSTSPSATTSFALPHTHHAPQPPTEDDTVTLSQTAQVSQMNGMGDTPEIIAQSLGLPVSLVNLDLGIVVTPTTTAPVVAEVIATRLK